MRAQRAFPVICILAAWLSFPVPAATKDQLVVAATIFPVADIARRVAGPEVRVIQVLPPGASPHTFDLTPGKIRELQPTHIIFKIGGIDDWIDGVGESLPQAAIVTLHKNISRLPFHEEGHDHGSRQREEEFDPHYWLSAKNGIIMARNIAEALAIADPPRATVYAENLRRIIHELEGLHGELQRELSALKSNRMIVFHDGWRYFAAAYGLEIAAVFQSSPGREPTPRDMQKLYLTARNSGVKAIFSEPQLPSASIEPLLHDLWLKLVILDPLGGTEPGDSYAGLLRRNARAIRRALEN